MAYRIIEKDCISCGTCVENCMFDAIDIIGTKGYSGYRINKAKCFGCGTCKKVCLNDCIEEVE